MFGFQHLFSGSQPAAKPAPAPANQGQPAQGQQQKTPTLPNGEGSQLETNQTQQQQNQQQVTSPLDTFKDLWEPVKTPEGTVQDQNNQQQQQPQKPNYAAAAKKIDFARLIPQELISKALAGDAASFSQVINAVSQASLAAAMQFTDGHSSRSSKTLEDNIFKALPDKFKQFSVANTPLKNPAAKHPAARPLVEAIKAQMATRFPDADPAELTTKAEEYFTAMFQELGKSTETQETQDATKQRAQQQQNGEYNWDEYFQLPTR